MGKKRRVIQQLFDALIQGFLVIFRDETEFVVCAQHFLHAGDLHGADGGPHDQRLGGGGGEALGMARADEQIAFGHIFVGVGVIAQEGHMVRNAVFIAEPFQLLLLGSNAQNVQMDGKAILPQLPNTVKEPMIALGLL